MAGRLLPKPFHRPHTPPSDPKPKLFCFRLLAVGVVFFGLLFIYGCSTMASLKRLVCASVAIVSSVVEASPLLLRSTAADTTACPGYTAANVQKTSSGLTADLTLAGEACNVYGTDLQDLTLTVEYQAGRFGLEVLAMADSGY